MHDADKQSTDNEVSSYEVGYKKPPRHTQFKKGQSGNPRGRKKGARNRLSYALPPEQLKHTLLAEAYREVTIHEPSGSKTMPTAQAIMRSLMIQAAKGKIGAQRLAMELILGTERDNRRQAEASAQWLIEYKQHWDEELANGYSGAPPIPHPDQIIIDTETGHMEIRGPLSEQEKEKQDFLANILSRHKVNLKEAEAQFSNADETVDMTALALDIKSTKDLISLIEEYLGIEEPSFFERVKAIGFEHFK